MLICTIVTICVVGAIINRPSESDVLSEIPTVIPEDEEILADETTVTHRCEFNYETKYDKTNHWKECSICGTKYELAAHTYTENWPMGDSCHPQNKCNYRCTCGYSYTATKNTISHKDIRPLSTNINSFAHRTSCASCRTDIKVERCTKEDGSQISCRNLGICTVCKQDYNSVGRSCWSYF